MKKLLSLLFVVAALAVTAKERITLISAYDNNPVPGATVIASNGLILGISDDLGRIEINGEKDLPLTIQSLGYESESVPAFTETVTLTPALYPLGEVEISDVARPIRKVTCLVREYSTGSTSTDTLQLYTEYMMTAYFADGKVKGYKKSDGNLKIRNRKAYALMKNTSGLDSVFVPDKDDDITLLSRANMVSSVPNKTISEPDNIKNGAPIDTIQGEFYPLAVMKKNKNIYTIEVDQLANFKDHKNTPPLSKLLGVTMDLEIHNRSRAYRSNDEGKYNLDDFIFNTVTTQILGRGKLIKKFFRSKEPVRMYSYQELYPVEKKYMTVEEYKADRSDKSDEPFVYPTGIKPLSPAITHLINRTKGRL